MKRGFDGIRKRAAEIGNYIADCNLCTSYYSDKIGEPEYCHNKNVTKFDIVNTEGGRTYCTLWKPELQEKEKTKRRKRWDDF
jgi:hypothetical protein